MQLIRKISTRTVYGPRADIQQLVLNKREIPHKLYRIIGICTGTRHGVSIENAEGEVLKAGNRAPREGEKMRDWTALLGAFQAENTRGEIFRSGVCFLPNYLIDSIEGQLKADLESGVRFAFDIFAQFDGNSATSYIYGAETLMQPTQDDPLNQLDIQLKTALTAPTTKQETLKEVLKEALAEKKAKS